MLMIVWLNIHIYIFSPGGAEDTVDGGILRVLGLQNKDVLYKNIVTALKVYYHESVQSLKNTKIHHQDHLLLNLLVSQTEE